MAGYNTQQDIKVLPLSFPAREVVVSFGQLRKFSMITG
jgi:hypothetical protein